MTKLVGLFAKMGVWVPKLLGWVAEWLILGDGWLS